MEKLERYIYAVTRKLPEKQRDDIEKELRGLIEDMLADHAVNGEPKVDDLDAVLTELGDPVELADQFRSKKLYLIGPDNFDLYFFVVKIVVAAVAFGISLALTISYVIDPPQSLLEVIGSYFSSIINAAFQGFAWVTVVFAIFEYFDVSLGKEFKDNKWTPDDLPQLPKKELIIKPAEAIVGIVFAVIAIVLFNTADHLLGIYIVTENEPSRIIPLFNHEVFRMMLPLLNIMLLIGIVKEVTKLLIGKWTNTLALMNLGFNIITLVLFIVFINSQGLLNIDFITYFYTIGLVPETIDPSALSGSLIKGFTVFAVIAIFIDSIVNLVKSVKFNMTK
ncbi:MAG: hypothetical protein SCJ94_04585 [Bacillota bacterium]|nr:hypothetical protein [Bacillota bacterium]